MEKYPIVAAGALILNKEGKIFLARSYKWKDRFTIPGGKVKLGETIEEALKREIKEEVGIDIEVIKILIVHDSIFSKDYYKSKHFIFLDYLCKAKTTDVKIDNDEIQEYIWIEPKKALTLDLDPFAVKAVERYLEGR